MIWARTVQVTVPAGDVMLGRTGMSAEERRLVTARCEWPVLVTGLDGEAREQLAEVVGPSWIGGSGDGVVIRVSMAAIAGWLPQLSAPLADALGRLVLATVTPTPTDIGGRTFAWGTRTHVMGVVNVTPDSFSDGGRFADAAAAIAHAEALADAGADLIDVGGESTRPGAAPVPDDEQLRRVIPVIEGLRKRRPGLPLSIDTTRARVAREALSAGAAMVNDVSGLADPALLEVLKATGAAACAMHAQGTPATMQQAPRYDDVGCEVLGSLELALRRAEAAGVARERVLVDPGIGFGKTVGHNLFLLQRLRDLRQLGSPVLVGASRKAFLGEVTGGRPVGQRQAASAASVAVAAALGGADLVRVHDVAEARDAVAVGDAIRAARDGGDRFP